MSLRFLIKGMQSLRLHFLNTVASVPSSQQLISKGCAESLRCWIYEEQGIVNVVNAVNAFSSKLLCFAGKTYTSDVHNSLRVTIKNTHMIS